MRNKRLSYIILGLVFFPVSCNEQSLTQNIEPAKANLLLLWAVQEGNLRNVRDSIQMGADINTRDDDGFTPLHYAVRGGHINITELLILKGANITARNNNGKTPLSFADGRKKIIIPPEPQDSDGYCQRGIYFYREKEYDLAIEDFTTAIELKSDNDYAYLIRGRARAQKGDTKKAIDNWKKALELNWRNALELYYARRLFKTSDEELDYLIKETAFKHLGDLNCISGCAIGYSAKPGDFYTVSLILSNPFEEEKFLNMLQSNNPVIQAMGLICLARENIEKYKNNIFSFYMDTTNVCYNPAGCVPEGITLGELSQKIIENPDTLDYWSPKHTRHRN